LRRERAKARSSYMRIGWRIIGNSMREEKRFVS